MTWTKSYIAEINTKLLYNCTPGFEHKWRNFAFLQVSFLYYFHSIFDLGCTPQTLVSAQWKGDLPTYHGLRHYCTSLPHCILPHDRPYCLQRQNVYGSMYACLYTYRTRSRRYCHAIANATALPPLPTLSFRCDWLMVSACVVVGIPQCLRWNQLPPLV